MALHYRIPVLHVHSMATELFDLENTGPESWVVLRGGSEVHAATKPGLIRRAPASRSRDYGVCRRSRAGGPPVAPSPWTTQSGDPGGRYKLLFDLEGLFVAGGLAVYLDAVDLGSLGAGTA